jgi:hypothetical protein
MSLVPSFLLNEGVYERHVVIGLILFACMLLKVGAWQKPCTHLKCIHTRRIQPMTVMEFIDPLALRSFIQKRGRDQCHSHAGFTSLSVGKEAIQERALDLRVCDHFF